MSCRLLARSCSTQEELGAKLPIGSYAQIRDIKSTAEGISVKATKDGRTCPRSSIAAAGQEPAARTILCLRTIAMGRRTLSSIALIDLTNVAAGSHDGVNFSFGAR